MKHHDGSSLTGKLLLAMPEIGDPRFHRSVILICAHDDQGAMGLVVNAPLENISFEQLIDNLGIASDIEVDLKALKLPVMNGGPVDNSRGFLLHSSEFKQDNTIYIHDDFSVTGTLDALEDVAQGKGPDKALFILGYAGWTPGQLEQELQQNAWLVLDPDPSLVFHGNTDEKWDLAVGRLGIDPAMLSGHAGRA